MAQNARSTSEEVFSRLRKKEDRRTPPQIPFWRKLPETLRKLFTGGGGRPVLLSSMPTG